MKIGEIVGYKSDRREIEFQHCGEVYDLWPDGIASCPEPMVKIKGKAGCVLERNCEVISLADLDRWQAARDRKAASEQGRLAL